VRALFAIVFLAFAAIIGPAAAVTPDEVLSDPALEARARTLSAELRCLVCQNQSIDDSEAPLAHDLRVLLRERIAAGDSDQAAVEFLVARYGEFILLKPRVNGHTLLLWVAPFAVLLIGGVAILFAVRRKRWAGPPPPDLSAAESEKLARIVDGEGAESR
jgi:cytochrome c-type biogenesis protein CcmH